ncbi:hypothetical protein IWW36_003896 [Coemansia brasiliensis]|uniref:S-formylglutathione hydrolase n=1 Tax=Coemansia brasiliensis TaxID=2650707 RepID=A0A9W8ID68_9FUNG|nr:hypothetical protein IWW36_003896 [Coemansia brasiliensis]
MNLLRSVYLRWKALRLPWRKEIFAGSDLDGNLYFERFVRGASRTRRRVIYRKDLSISEYSDKIIPVQWQAWMRHTRQQPPTVSELLQDIRRQERIAANVLKLAETNSRKPNTSLPGEKFQPENCDLELVSKNRCFAGEVRKYRHASVSTKCTMSFNIYLPDTALSNTTKVPVLFYLSGLTCNEDNMITKGGAIPFLSSECIALVVPDTSPRSSGIEGEDDDWELGTGAGFYVDATQEPWRNHYNMYSYVQTELQQLVFSSFSIDSTRVSIFGHSMGGHGALILSLRNPGYYKSASAFAPICHPSTSNWGQKQFKAYLGPNTEDWAKYDATELVKTYDGPELPILLDQGDSDQFYTNKQLQPSHFVIATKSSKNAIQLQDRMQPGYDHSYYFIQTFMEDHIKFHARYLKN